MQKFSIFFQNKCNQFIWIWDITTRENDEIFEQYKRYVEFAWI